MEVLDAPAQLAALPAMADADPALMAQVLDEAGKFVGEVVAPLNAAGDATGCTFNAGGVATPPGFRDAYQAFWQARDYRRYLRKLNQKAADVLGFFGYSVARPEVLKRRMDALTK